MSDTPGLLGDNSNRETDQLLNNVGEQGLLDDLLTEADIDQMLANLPLTPVTAEFSQRAMAAMARAQEERENYNPAIALGAALARARQKAGLALDQVGRQTGISSTLLDELERGHTTVPRLLYLLPAEAGARLVQTIQIPVHEFTSRVLEFASAGSRSHGGFSGVAHRAQQADSASLVRDVAEYVTKVEQLTHTI